MVTIKSIEKLYLEAAVQALNIGTVPAKRLALKIRDEWEMLRFMVDSGISLDRAVKSLCTCDPIVAHKIGG